MQKIPSLLKRDYQGDRLVYPEVVPGTEWVLEGEGIATRKWDGTCCLVRGGRLYKRYTLKKGKQPPPDFEPATELDEKTGKQEGWVPVGYGPDDKWHRRALKQYGWEVGDGTYELVGPKVQGNPEGFDEHILIRHGIPFLNPEPERTFDGIRQYLDEHNIEGIVWHHPDGRKAKIKAKDFNVGRARRGN